MKFWILVLVGVLFQCSPSETPHHHTPNSEEPVPIPKSKNVTVELEWEYRNLPKTLEMQIYEPKADRPATLWQTGTAREESRVPISIPLGSGDQKIVLEPGSKKLFVLVLKNRTQKDIYFFAAPHHAYPEEASLGFKFKCLCINHAFTLPAGEIWYRVVELKISKDYHGNNLKLHHSLIGIEKERVGSFSDTNQDDYH